eukprot:gene8575-399_t
MLFWNGVFILVFAGLHASVVLLVSRLNKRPFRYYAGKLFFPSSVLYLLLFLSQPIAWISMKVWLKSAAWSAAAVAFFTVFCVMIPGYGIYYLRGRKDEQKYVEYQEDLLKGWRKYIIPSGNWFPSGVRGRYGAYFANHRGEALWFGIPLLILPVVFGLIAAVEPRSDTGCRVQFAAIVAILLLMAIISTRFPMRQKLSSLLIVSLYLFQALFVLALLLAATQEDNHWLGNVAVILQICVQGSFLSYGLTTVFGMIYEQIYLEKHMKAKYEEEERAAEKEEQKETSNLNKEMIKDAEIPAVPLQAEDAEAPPENRTWSDILSLGLKTTSQSPINDVSY